MTKALIAATEALTEAIRDQTRLLRSDTPACPAQTIARSLCDDTALAFPLRLEPESGPTGQADDSSDGATPGVWISAEAPEWPLWDAWWRAHKGKSPPRDLRNGWRFPSLTPPAAEH